MDDRNLPPSYGCAGNQTTASNAAFSTKLGRDEFVIVQHRLINGAEGNAADEAVRCDETVERIASPAQFQRPLNQTRKGNVIHLKSWVGHELRYKTWIIDSAPTNLSEKLNFQ